MLRFLIMLGAFAVTMMGPASAQTAAETNPEAVYISRTYNVPQLNGRLMLPETFANTPLAAPIDPIWKNWNLYLTNFLLDPNNPQQMMQFMANRPNDLRQILATHTTLPPDRINTLIANQEMIATGMALRHVGLNDFQLRDVRAAIANLYRAQARQPASPIVPVTALLAARLGRYNFDDQTLGMYVAGWGSVPALPRNWQHEKLPSSISITRLMEALPLAPQVAEATVTAAATNTFGPGMVYVGIEGSLRPKSRETGINATRIVLSLSPDLRAPFYVLDLDQRKADQQQAEMRADLAARQAEASKKTQQAQDKANGFDFDLLAARFETGGLRIGAPPPEGLKFRLHLNPRSQIKATLKFFLAEVSGGQIGFMTRDGTAKSEVIFLARGWADENLTREAFKEVALAKLGRPSSAQGQDAFWHSPKLPAGGFSECMVDAGSFGVGAARTYNGRFPRSPMYLDVNQFKNNCGVVATMDFYSKKYAVADTTWLNAALLEALSAQKASEQKAQQKAVSEIDF